MTYNVFGGTLSLTQSINLVLFVRFSDLLANEGAIYNKC